MATTRLRTIKPSGQGGDYTSVSAWEAGEQTNLVTADEIRIGEYQGDWSAGPDGPVTINGSTADATRYLELRTDAANFHGGTWSALKARIASASGAAVTVSDPYTRLIGLQAEVTGVDAYSFAGGSAPGTTADACLAKLVGNGADGFICGSSTGSATLRNCVAFGDGSTTQRGVVVLTNVAAQIDALNCTVYGCTVGYSRSVGVLSTTNCMAQACGTDNAGSPSGDYNCDEDGTAPGANSVTETVTFVDGPNGDLHISSATSAVTSGGTDLSGSGVTTDFEGQARHASTPTIGADEYGTAGIDITGAASFAWQGAGALQLASALSGAAGFSWVSAAALQLASGITGSASMAWSSTGGLQVTSTISGAGSMAWSASGALQVTSPISGAGSFALSAAGLMQLASALNGAGSFSWGSVGSLQLASGITGSASMAWQGAGSLGLADAGGIVGAASMAWQGAGALQLESRIVGVGSFTMTASGQILIPLLVLPPPDRTGRVEPEVRFAIVHPETRRSLA